MRSIPDETYGVIENVLATLILFSPNFLLLFDFFQHNFILLIFYNLVIMFIIVSALSHLKFRKIPEDDDGAT